MLPHSGQQTKKKRQGLHFGNFFTKDQYFPYKVVLYEPDDFEYKLRLEVLVNNNAIVVRGSTKFLLKKGPLYDLGNGIAIDSSQLN